MNSISHIIANTILIGLLSSSLNKAQASNTICFDEIKKDSSSYIQIQSTIVVETKDVKGTYLVEVLYFDSTFTSYTVKNNTPVNLSLKRNSSYVLKISKKGFIPRYICINTSTNATSKETGAFNFYLETDFIKTEEAMRMDAEALELPVAMITFNNKIGNFENNKGYALFVRQKLHFATYDMSQMSAKN